MEGRLGCLNRLSPCSSVAIFTGRNTVNRDSGPTILAELESAVARGCNSGVIG
jgi:hypothetical protein